MHADRRGSWQPLGPCLLDTRPGPPPSGDTILVAHLPAGYLLGRLVAPRPQDRRTFVAVLAGSVLPDLDMLWWVFSTRDVGHHALFPHRPLTWAAVALVGAVLWGVHPRTRRWGAAALGLAGGALLHCILDTPVGGIPWRYPWSDALVHGLEIVVPVDQSPPLPAGLSLGRSWMWVWHFVHHWTFAVETFLTGLAVGVWAGGRRRAG